MNATCSPRRQLALPARFCCPNVLSPDFLTITKASRRYTPSAREHSALYRDDDVTQSSQLPPHYYFPRALPSEPAIKRFRRAVNVVRRQLPWFRLWARDVEDCCKGISDDGPPGLNVGAFRPTSEQLSGKAKLILMKSTDTRTTEELQFVDRCIFRLKCFEQYTSQVRKQLSKVLHFEEFGKGRVVIRQGHPGYSVYFIVSGCVTVEEEGKDRRPERQVLTELRSGSSFGESSRVGNDRRTATVVCKEYSEFLKMDHHDFDYIIRSAQRSDLEIRSRCIREHPILRELDPRHQKLAVDASKIVRFPSNAVILRKFSEPSDMVYFITAGYCKVVQRVELWRVGKTSKSSKLVLPSIGTSCRGASLEPQKKWWTLRTLSPGDYFGIGEGPVNSCVVSDAVKVECLSVDATALSRHQNGRFLSGIRELARGRYPSLPEAFASYIENTKWKEYKEEVVKELVDCKQRRSSSAIVPMVLRDYTAGRQISVPNKTSWK